MSNKQPRHWRRPQTLKRRIQTFFGVLGAALCAGVNPALAQGTAFTYQTKLDESGGPVSGSYDLMFTLYDSTNVPGNVVAGPITNSATAVTNGLITVTLDFGKRFDGNPRWLEVAVRTNGAAAFTTLTPRQPLLPVPYAIMANSASNLLGALPASQLSGTVPLDAVARRGGDEQCDRRKFKRQLSAATSTGRSETCPAACSI